ncbi:hypothetical protein DL98DRAFT_517640 [Cadophora sp. DSE1049]|nr:hypothetical protein DL98DRAFT_517640 [Cadophora sp. DSE1049]
MLPQPVILPGISAQCHPSKPPSLSLKYPFLWSVRILVYGSLLWASAGADRRTGYFGVEWWINCNGIAKSC